MLFSSQFIDKFIFSGMPYAFSAFGLIISNSVYLEARKVNILYVNLQYQSFIKIEDDTICPFPHDELLKHLSIWGSFDEYKFNTSNKKLKSYAQKQKEICQYCNNIKLGGLRLGDSILWVARNSLGDYGQTIVYSIDKIHM